jgi:hypothetical protein
MDAVTGSRILRPVPLSHRRILGAYASAALVFSEKELDDDDPGTERRKFLAEFSTTVLSGRRIEQHPSVTHQVPASWWQHLKDDCLPAWARRRWPVRYRELKTTLLLEQDILFPYADFVPPPPDQFGRPVLWESLSAESGPGILQQGEGRFLDRLDVLHYFYLWLERTRPAGTRVVRDPYEIIAQFFEWLELSGVNPDELVCRGYEKRPL